MLDAALDIGINEFDYWEMTIPELERKFNSHQRAVKQKAIEKATYDYILADLIGRSVSRVYNKSAKLPEIYEVYPQLFDSKDIEQERHKQKTLLSSLRFKQFANFHNKNFNGGGKNNNE